jgi:hypothetical protein
MAKKKTFGGVDRLFNEQPVKVPELPEIDIPDNEPLPIGFYKDLTDDLTPGIKSVADEEREIREAAAKRPKPGRKATRPEPKDEKSSKSGCRSGETRATFIVSDELLDRVKALAYWERTKIKHVIEAALTEHLSRHEDKHGKIKPMPREG